MILIDWQNRHDYQSGYQSGYVSVWNWSSTIGIQTVDWMQLCGGVGATSEMTATGYVPYADAVGAGLRMTAVGLPGTC